MMNRPKLFLATMMIVASNFVASPAFTQNSDWAGRAFGGVPGPSAKAEITIGDIARLRDIGGLRISPDGEYLAFSVRQAVPENNAYVIRWFIARTRGDPDITSVNIDGGQPIPLMLLGQPQAALPDELPVWSPDSKRFAVRRMTGREIGLWVIDVASGRTTMAAEGADEVEHVSWMSPSRLKYTTGLSFERYQALVDVEGRHGWLWDGRIAPSTSRLRPTVPDCTASPDDAACANQTRVFDVTTVTSEPVDPSASDARPTGEATRAPRRADGYSLRLDNVDPRYAGASTPVVRIATDAPGAKKCRSDMCIGARFRSFGWASNGKRAWFVKSTSDLGRDDGAPGDMAGIFEWRLNSGGARKTYSIAGTLDNCQAASEEVFCVEESATRPAAIVAVSLRTGKRRVIANPNPMFERKRYPRIERLILHDASGGPYFAQLVYPTSFDPSKKYPLVITQYNNRGFLRGQVGNEYPIYPMAEAGFFVLSVNWGRPPNDQTKLSIDRLNLDYSLHGREIVWNVIESGLDSAIATGNVDEHRVALTGLSAGAEIVNYVLQRTDRFAAAIASSGAQDATFFALAPEGPLRNRLMNEFNTKVLFDGANAALNDMAWSNKGEKLRTPYLINVGEYEAMLGFEGTQSIIHAGGPLEIRIFPDEQHIKYQPRTYIGIYENNMQWLKFWLKDEVDPSRELAVQYKRWREMARKLRD